MILNFRTLKASEIDVKPQTVKENGFSLLLYKNARVDMDVLDETVGPLNWQRKHSRENANCIVSIYDEDKKIWVEKEDTGTESFTEKEKGKGKGFTLIQRTGRSLAVGRPSGSAVRVRRGDVGGVFHPARLHLNGGPRPLGR